MSWTTPDDIAAQVQRLWDKGLLLAAQVDDALLFPRRMVLKGPTSGELTGQFAAVRDWIARLQEGAARGYRLVWREVNHRVLGPNALPAEVWIDSFEAAMTLIGKRAAADRFAALLVETRTRHPALTPWLARRPLVALGLAAQWPLLLDIVSWMLAHPRPGIYLRQVDILGVHSKWIEAHCGVLSELLDLALTPGSIQPDAVGRQNFCRRYGFRDKPIRIRFRLFDPGLNLFPGLADHDWVVTREAFARLAVPVRQVFITENEINFLAFPPVARGMVIFGAGYGFEMLAEADWLRDCAVYYWGDIDTHGFAILNQLRAQLPQARSLLMDRETLLGHRAHWGVEPQPELRDLSRLTDREAALYDDLRHNTLGRQVRLEQEKIGFSWLERALETIEAADNPIGMI